MVSKIYTETGSHVPKNFYSLRPPKSSRDATELGLEYSPMRPGTLRFTDPLPDEYQNSWTD